MPGIEVHILTDAARTQYDMDMLWTMGDAADALRTEDDELVIDVHQALLESWLDDTPQQHEYDAVKQ